MTRRLAAGCLVAAIAAAGGMPADAAPEPGEPGFGVRFLEEDIAALSQPSPFDIEDPMETFAHVFAALRDDVTVHPTENYYYFTFFWGGLEFAGNMRLDASDRDDGILHFAYFIRERPWLQEWVSEYRALAEQDGLRVERRDNLVYDVTFDERTVTFRLNDLRDAEPADGAVRDGEVYLGPVFDDAAISLLFVFDEERRSFRFVLDETRPVHDTLVPVHPEHDQLVVGMRTGFAFYRDRYADRAVLVGVNAAHVAENTPLDGPFDQLPDNFLEGDALRDAIIAVHPELDGEIDRYGAFLDGEGRFLVSPYMHYHALSELETLLRCADPSLDEDRYYACLSPGAGG